MSPDMQPWISSSAGYALFGMLTTAIAAMFAYGKVIFDRLHNSMNQTIEQQKTEILLLEGQVRAFTEAKNASAAALLLQARIDSQEKQLDQVRDEQVEATERRFREMLADLKRSVDVNSRYLTLHLGLPDDSPRAVLEQVADAFALRPAFPAWIDAEQGLAFSTTVVTPRKCPGRAAPSMTRERCSSTT